MSKKYLALLATTSFISAPAMAQQPSNMRDETASASYNAGEQNRGSDVTQGQDSSATQQSGRPTNGRPTNGRPTNGRPTDGRPAGAGRPTEKKGWEVSIAAGAIYSPSYLGDDKNQLSIVPGLSVKYNDLFFASIEGIGFNIINNDRLVAGPIAKVNFGRNDDGGGPFTLSKNTNDLIGLNDVNATMELGGFAEYKIGKVTGKLQLRKAVSGHNGVVGEVELKYDDVIKLFKKRAFLSIGPEIKFADDRHNSAFFDIDAGQSTASGLPIYDANGGINSYGIGGTIILPLDKSFTLVSFAGFDRLTGDIANSPLVQQRGSKNQASAGIVLSYTF